MIAKRFIYFIRFWTSNEYLFVVYSNYVDTFVLYLLIDDILSAYRTSGWSLSTLNSNISPSCLQSEIRHWAILKDYWYFNLFFCLLNSVLSTKKLIVFFRVLRLTHPWYYKRHENLSVFRDNWGDIGDDIHDSKALPILGWTISMVYRKMGTKLTLSFRSSSFVLLSFGSTMHPRWKAAPSCYSSPPLSRLVQFFCWKNLPLYEYLILIKSSGLAIEIIIDNRKNVITMDSRGSLRVNYKYEQIAFILFCTHISSISERKWMTLVTTT